MKKKSISFATSEALPSPYYEHGKLVVPAEHELYYATTWKWKILYPMDVTPDEYKFVKEYEKKHGEIHQWKDLTGNMRPIVDGRKAEKYGKPL
jgi:hypothetical protein